MVKKELKIQLSSDVQIIGKIFFGIVAFGLPVVLSILILFFDYPTSIADDWIGFIIVAALIYVFEARKFSKVILTNDGLIINGRLVNFNDIRTFNSSFILPSRKLIYFQNGKEKKAYWTVGIFPFLKKDAEKLLRAKIAEHVQKE